ncbi:MAG: protein translocase subunit SecD [Nocardioides sp.]
MARKPNNPGRTLVVFFLGAALTYGLVALTGTWKPELGLDLQGGTRIQLQAIGDPTPESLDEARKIIDQRVNGSGVAEAEVTTQSGRFVVVEIPGEQRRDLEETVKRQAQLRFRLVACSDQEPCGAPVDPTSPTVPDAPPEPPGVGVTPPAEPSAAPDGSPPASGGAANRAPVGFSQDATTSPSAQPTDQPTAEPTNEPTDSPPASPGDPGSGIPTDAPVDGSPSVVPEEGEQSDVDAALAFMNNPDPAAVEQFNMFQCDGEGLLQKLDGSPAEVVDDPDQPLVACSPPEAESGDDPAVPSFKYLLSKAVIEGTDLDSASAGIPQGQLQWVVDLQIGGGAVDTFTTISQTLLCPSGGPECDQFAIALDGSVISAPTMNGLINNGQAQISGNFTETSANSLATSLKFGALPISFADDPLVEQVGPTLAGDQLRAGLTAGLFGLLLVMIYCLIYYRGLGLVVISSLFVAAAITYAMVLLLSEAANFTLTLPGIAGLIVAVGITADSFIVFFERIRDEMRDGKSMRVAVESGWLRARNTCLAADAVSLLAAVVLFIFAAGVVKGFAFALGLSTLIDLVVFFFFTKPMVSWLARFKFFNQGHKLSGLDAEALGIDSINLGNPDKPAAPSKVGGRV